MSSKTYKQGDPIEVITRKDWRAEVPVSPIRMQEPAKQIFYTETETLECKTKAQCMEMVRGIQKFHMDFRGLSDIQYHFIIGGDGNIYEGRSWFTSGIEYPKENSRITTEMTGKCLEIAFVGSYKDKEPSDAMKVAANSLVYYGLQNKLLHESISESQQAVPSEQSEKSIETQEPEQLEQSKESIETQDSKLPEKSEFDIDRSTSSDT